MPRELTPQEYAVMQIDTDYLNAGIPIFGSRVVRWENMTVLIYHTEKLGYVLTDISDFGQAKINQLAMQSEVHGMWYYLVNSTQEVIAERAEEVADIAEQAGKTAAEITQAVAQSAGKTLHDLITPLVSALFVPLVITGVLLGIYLFKKG